MPIGLVSVIIPVYNGLPDLDVQLKALEVQDYSGDFEVIISDNGSTDGLREHLGRRDSSLDLTLIDSSRVRGPSHARNVGLEVARGEFLAFVDADDAVHPDWLTALTLAAADYDAVGGSCESDSLNSAEVATWRVMLRPEEQPETVYLPFAGGNNFGIWSRVIKELGGFDETLTAGEDIDISWRIKQAGFTLGHVPDAVVAYRVRSTMKASFVQGLSYGRASRPLTSKHSAHGCPNPSTLVAVPAHLWALVFLTIAKNPWLPRALGPMSRGYWAFIMGQQLGALQIRMRPTLEYSSRQRTYLRLHKQNT